jgi:penicillin-binding protein 2
MGVDAIHDFMKPLGFGQTTGIDLNGEVRGTLPSTEWKRNTYKRPEMKRWFPGETISLGIGQGYNNSPCCNWPWPSHPGQQRHQAQAADW